MSFLWCTGTTVIQKLTKISKYDKTFLTKIIKSLLKCLIFQPSKKSLNSPFCTCLVTYSGHPPGCPIHDKCIPRHIQRTVQWTLHGWRDEKHLSGWYILFPWVDSCWASASLFCVHCALLLKGRVWILLSRVVHAQLYL